MPNKLKLFLREFSLSLSSEQLIVARRILEVLQSDKITLSPYSHQRAPYCPVLICREVEHSTRKKINGAVAYRDMVVKVLYLPEELLDLFNIDEAANLFFGGEDISVNRFIKFHLDEFEAYTIRSIHDSDRSVTHVGIPPPLGGGVK